MSTLTTTDERRPWLLSLCGLALAVWFGGVAVIAVLIDPPAIVVFGSRVPMLNAIAAEEGLLLSAGNYFVTARLTRSGTVRQLYAQGAWFIWPVMRAGCT